MDDDLMILTDEDGSERQFELLDVIEHRGEEYVVLYPADGGDEEQVHIPVSYTHLDVYKRQALLLPVPLR